MKVLFWQRNNQAVTKARMKKHMLQTWLTGVNSLPLRQYLVTSSYGLLAPCANFQGLGCNCHLHVGYCVSRRLTCTRGVSLSCTLP